MKKLDRIKSLVAVVLVIIVLLPFTILGKDHDITRYAAVFSLISWLVLMFIAGRLKNKGQ
ncbi:MAG: hypothetical protein RIC15_04450 [Vicingaceae bacterium]